jgi:hypothetical protein
MENIVPQNTSFGPAVAPTDHARITELEATVADLTAKLLAEQQAHAATQAALDAATASNDTAAS